MRTLLATAVLVLVTSGPASAVDADQRLGDRLRPERVRTGVLLLADPKPDSHCMRFRTVPVARGRDLLYRPCQDDVVLPPVKPWGDEPPVVIPALPRR